MKTRMFRKVRKAKKTRRGGYPVPIPSMIPFTVSNGNPTDFKPNFAFENPDSLKELFISAVFDYIHRDDPPVDLFSQNEEVLEEENASVQIHRIRGQVNRIVFNGNINEWTNEQIKNFVANLKKSDRINIEPITIIE